MGAGPVWGVSRRDPKLPVVITPDQITANVNDYDPGFFLVGLDQPTYILRLSSDVARDVTGIVAPSYDGQMVYILNVGTQNIVLQNQDTNSQEPNRFLSSSGGDVTLAADGWAMAIYDQTTQRWRL